MHTEQHFCNSSFFTIALTAALAITIVFTMVVLAQSAQAQSILYSFTGGQDGAVPWAGITMDQAGSLYGTTCGGFCSGGNGSGTVFKLSNNGSGWVFTRLYSFPGGSDGAAPIARVIIGPDGSLYGTTAAGGIDGGCSYGGTGCGIVFKLTPPAHVAPRAMGGWTETVLYRFTGGSDGASPGYGDLTFDQAGNIYGTTILGGANGTGTVYELTPSSDGWRESVLYSFGSYIDAYPFSGVIFDQSGNLYGTACGYNCFWGQQGQAGGTVYQLTPSASGWIENTLYDFHTTGGYNGSGPVGGLTFDPSGYLLYGTTSGLWTGGGTAFRLPGSFFEKIYDFPASGFEGPTSSPILDSAGKLHGTDYGLGSFFTLTQHCICTCYWEATYLGLGGHPSGNIASDGSGNYYGTITDGGTYGFGGVFKVGPLASTPASSSNCAEGQ